MIRHYYGGRPRSCGMEPHICNPKVPRSTAPRYHLAHRRSASSMQESHVDLRSTWTADEAFHRLGELSLPLVNH